MQFRISKFAVLSSQFIAVMLLAIVVIYQFCFITNQSHYLSLALPLAVVVGFVVASLSVKPKLQYWLAVGTVIFIFGVIAWFSFDKNGDGRWYHQDAIILIKNGWNPVYDFTNIDLNERFIFSKIYPIIIETLASSFDLTFGHIQLGKIVNFLLVIDCICISYLMLSSFKLSSNQSLLIAGFITLNPLVVSQLLSFSVDGNLFCGFTILLFSTLAWLNTKEVPSVPKYFWQLHVILGFIILANIKSTGLVYATMIVLIPVATYYITNRKNLLPIIGVLLLLFVLETFIGYHPYIQNVINGRNIFWPIAGQGNIFQPQVTIVSSKVLNCILSYFTPYPLNSFHLSVIPEIRGFVSTDIGYGALGPFFGIMFIIGIYYISKYLVCEFKGIKSLRSNFMLFSIMNITIIIILSILLFPFPWIARYVPQIFLIPVLGTLIINIYRVGWWDKYIKLVLIVMVVNSGLFLGGSAVMTGYRTYKLYAMENFCLHNKCIFEIRPGAFDVSFPNQLHEEGVIINLGSCQNRTVIWQDVKSAQMQLTNTVCW